MSSVMTLKRYPSQGGMTFGKIGARRMMWQGKTARDYVQDGLVAMWDGIENAGWGTHDANATVWKDLVGNNDLTILGAVQDNCIRTTNTAAAEMTGVISGIATIEVCFLCNSINGNNTQGLVFYSGSIDTSNFGLVVYGPNVGFQTLSNKFWDYPTVSTPQHYSVSATISSCQVNGVSLATASHATDQWNNGNHTEIGGRAWQNVYKAYGDYYNVRLYNRALTASEIAANYAVDKLRFNLP